MSSRRARSRHLTSLRSPHARRGSSLVELLTALPLMAVATGCALLLLVQAAADRRAHQAAHTGVRELRHARAVLAAELAPLRARELLTVTDTLLAVLSQQGIVTVCTSDSLTVDVAPALGASSAWLDALRAGDPVLGFASSDALEDPPRPIVTALAAPARRLGVGPCGRAITRRWRLTHGGVVANGRPLARGAPLVVQREVQYVHYRSNGQWWLGRRARDGAAWETVQPIAGPLESPARRGLAMVGLTAAHAPTRAADSIAALAITLRSLPVMRSAPSASPRRLVLPADSLTSELPLRSESWSRGAP
ncbi:MAG: hypothetical protein K2R93_15540 [Gemmatimonadaceae bacterium]|nr:hypothetical protein [Gemmatimonadaceae bacterium]